MRICLLAHNFREDNGGGVFARHLKHGFEKKLGASVTALTLSSRPAQFLISLPRLFRAAKNCDVVHALDAYPYGVLAAIATRLFKKPLIITAVGTGSLQLFYHTRFLLTRLMRWSYAQAWAITAISHFTRDLILAQSPGLAISVINPGVDYEEMAHATEKEKEMFSDLRPYILSVGTIRWRKGYKRSIKAFARVREQFPDMKYVIVGKKYSEKYYREIARLIHDLRLEKSVLILEDVNDIRTLRALYHNAELFCLLSQQFGHDVEGFGMVFLEAAAAGLPVVGSTESGIKDAVENGKNGFLVDWRDEKGELAEKIVLLLRDTRLYTQMSEASLGWAKASDWDKKMDAYASIYRTLLSAP